MGPLSDIFSSDDSSSSDSSSNSSDFMGDLTSTVGLDASSSSDSYSADEGGNVEANSTDNSLGLDTSTDGLLHGITDNFSSSSDSTSDQ
ncbi:hypothetical protein [Sphingomonas xinjiangensis]|uniref:Uncharacterized protein n=1 Tax=Sphingomonas xinjiangensis TaxID=643568 RepID=A0A840YKU4_9SPHN|nr:hypothetical protein [Sphingomonas xinjiangensis]MBB5709886.1 hypothetical protein [Sphingomonas xinjiangensis]